MIAYNQSTPPEYNLKAISAPVALLYGANDPLGQPQVSITSFNSKRVPNKLCRIIYFCHIYLSVSLLIALLGVLF